MCCEDLLIPVMFFSLSSWCLFDKLKILILMSNLEFFVFIIVKKVLFIFIFYLPLPQSHKALFIYCFIVFLFTFMTFIYLTHVFVECRVSTSFFFFSPYE